MVPWLALLVKELAKLLAILERLRLTGPTPISRRLHAIVGIVCELAWAIRAAEDASPSVTFITLRVTSIVAHLLIGLAFGVFAGASTHALHPTRLRRHLFLGWLWLFCLRLWLWLFWLLRFLGLWLIWLGLIWLGLVWLGLVWLGLVWLGLFWLGLFWFGFRGWWCWPLNRLFVGRRLC